MGKESHQENRREFPRVNLELKAVYRVLNLERNEGNAEIQNLSYGGLMFISSDALTTGDLLDIIIYYKAGDISFNAKVVWAEPLGELLPPEHNIGIKYMSLSSMDKNYLSLIIASTQGQNL